MKSLLVPAARSDAGSPGSRRQLVRLLGVAPAALFLSGLFAGGATEAAGAASGPAQISEGMKCAF